MKFKSPNWSVYLFFFHFSLFFLKVLRWHKSLYPNICVSKEKVLHPIESSFLCFSLEIIFLEEAIWGKKNKIQWGVKVHRCEYKIHDFFCKKITVYNFFYWHIALLLVSFKKSCRFDMKVRLIWKKEGVWWCLYVFLQIWKFYLLYGIELKVLQKQINGKKINLYLACLFVNAFSFQKVS